jgi:hypothetical protein
MCGAAAFGERLGPDQREGHGAFPFYQPSKKSFSRVAGAEPPRGMGGAQCGAPAPLVPLVHHLRRQGLGGRHQFPTLFLQLLFQHLHI